VTSNRRAGILGRADTRRLPSAMHNTKTATIIANVNGEDPNASAPIRLSVTWRVIMAKPASRATTP